MKLYIVVGSTAFNSIESLGALWCHGKTPTQTWRTWNDFLLLWDQDKVPDNTVAVTTNPIIINEWPREMSYDNIWLRHYASGRNYKLTKLFSVEFLENINLCNLYIRGELIKAVQRAIISREQASCTT